MPGKVTSSCESAPGGAGAFPCLPLHLAVLWGVLRFGMAKKLQKWTGRKKCQVAAGWLVEAADGAAGAVGLLGSPFDLGSSVSKMGSRDYSRVSRGY